MRISDWSSDVCSSDLDVDRTQTRGVLAGFLRAVVALHMLTRPRNGENVEQLEIIEAQHVHQRRGASPILGEVEPAVELPLRLADGRVDARNTLLARKSCVEGKEREGGVDQSGY